MAQAAIRHEKSPREATRTVPHADAPTLYRRLPLWGGSGRTLTQTARRWKQE